MRAVSDEMVLTLSVAGTADDVAARISALLVAVLILNLAGCGNASVNGSASEHGGSGHVTLGLPF